LNMEAFIDSESTRAIKKQADLEVSQAILDEDYKLATDLNEGYKPYLSEQYFTNVNQINKAEATARREAAIASIYNAETEQDRVDALIAIQDSDEFTVGQKQELENIAENIDTRKSTNFEILRKAEKRRGEVTVSEAFNSEVYTEEAQAVAQSTILEMSESQDPETQSQQKN